MYHGLCYWDGQVRSTGKWTESAHTPPHNRKDEILYARCCNRSFGKKVSRETGKEGSPSHSESREAILLLPFHNLVIRGRRASGGSHAVGTHNASRAQRGVRPR